MTQDNVVYIQQTGLARLERAGNKLDAVGRQSTQIVATPTRGFVAFEPVVPRCKTCAYFTEFKGVVEAGHCNQWRTQLCAQPRPVPIDGSGYCHRHEVVW
jgi:hypothetical protein